MIEKTASEIIPKILEIDSPLNFLRQHPESCVNIRQESDGKKIKNKDGISFFGKIWHKAVAAASAKEMERDIEERARSDFEVQLESGQSPCQCEFQSS